MFSPITINDPWNDALPQANPSAASLPPIRNGQQQQQSQPAALPANTRWQWGEKLLI